MEHIWKELGDGEGRKWNHGIQDTCGAQTGFPYIHEGLPGGEGFHWSWASLRKADCPAMSGRTQQARVTTTCCCRMLGGEPWLAGAPRHQGWLDDPWSLVRVSGILFYWPALWQKGRTATASLKLGAYMPIALLFFSENSKCGRDRSSLSLSWITLMCVLTFNTNFSVLSLVCVFGLRLQW